MLHLADAFGRAGRGEEAVAVAANGQRWARCGGNWEAEAEAAGWRAEGAGGRTAHRCGEMKSTDGSS